MSRKAQTARRVPIREGGFFPTNTHVVAVVHGALPSFSLPSIFGGKELDEKKNDAKKKKTQRKEKKKCESICKDNDNLQSKNEKRS